MAYSNYGAYIWKNGVDKTKECADRSYYYNDMWKVKKPQEELEEWEDTQVGGHAVLALDNKILLCFYKTHSLDIYYGCENDKIISHKIDIENDILKLAEYTDPTKQIKISGYSIDSDESIYMYEIQYENDIWCVVIGSAFGNGWDTRRISKFVRNNIDYRDRNGEYFYILETESIYQIDYICRQDDLDDEKQDLWRYGIKPFLKNLFSFHWNYLSYYIGEIESRLVNIKYLK